MFNPDYPLFPIVSFLGFVLPLLPLPWHLRSWNSGTCYYAIWASLSSLNQFINSILWAGDAVNRAPVFCDISTKISLGASVALPAASLCIQRRLYYIVSRKAAEATEHDKRQAVIVDSLICLGFPMIFMALRHRFDVFEDAGCRPSVYNTPVALILTYTPPLAIGIISAIYCALSFRNFSSRRAQIRQFLASNTSGLTRRNYIRFRIVVLTEIILTIPLSLMVIALNAFTTPVFPYISWENVHSQFSRVRLVPALLWRTSPLSIFAVEFPRWLTPACALFFFAIFGLSEEARENYCRIFAALQSHVGLHRKGANLTRDDRHSIQFHVSVQASSLFLVSLDQESSSEVVTDYSDPECILGIPKHDGSMATPPISEKNIPDV